MWIRVGESMKLFIMFTSFSMFQECFQEIRRPLYAIESICWLTFELKQLERFHRYKWNWPYIFAYPFRPKPLPFVGMIYERMWRCVNEYFQNSKRANKNKTECHITLNCLVSSCLKFLKKGQPLLQRNLTLETMFELKKNGRKFQSISCYEISNY